MNVIPDNFEKSGKQKFLNEKIKFLIVPLQNKNI